MILANWNWFRGAALAVACITAGFACGCGNDAKQAGPPAKTLATPAPVDATAGNKVSPQVASEIAKPKVASTKANSGSVNPAKAVEADLAAQWKTGVAELRQLIAAGKLDEAQRALKTLSKVNGAAQLTAEQLSELQAFEMSLAQQRRAHLEGQRVENLVRAAKALDFAQFEVATRCLEDVLAHNPTPDQQTKARALTDEIERRRRAKRDLQAYLNMLGASGRREVEAAQFELIKDPDAALSILAEITLRTDKPTLVKNALETLGMLDRPERALPIMAEMLKRNNQQAFWPDAMREIARVGKAGAGATLLEVAASAGPVESRLAALEALTQIVDPPARTLVALLPLLAADGPMLRQALAAAARAVALNGQADVAARRGLDFDLTPAQEEQLEKLPDRLAAIVKAAGATASDVAYAAQTLQMALRLTAPVPLTGVKLHLVEADSPEGPAAAALDGVWNSVDPKTIWRHPVEKRSSITLDLGQERLVAAVKLWNFNEPSGATRGWKEYEVYVGNSPSETIPVAKGIVPMAPGAADTPDYGSLLPLPMVRGRYVRLQATSLWLPNTYTGLSEVQVLGF